MPRSQFTLRAFLVAMLVVAAFFGGVQFERERQRREDETLALEEERLAFEAKLAGKAELARKLREALAERARLSESTTRLRKAVEAYREKKAKKPMCRSKGLPG